MLYRRRELWLLLALAVALGVGFAVGQFRSGFPELADRLETLDSDASPPALPPPRAAPAPQPKMLAIRPTPDGRLDLNRVTADELRRLPGIGPTLAAEIVRARERRGGFAAADDLRAVPGMGARKFERIRDLVTVGGPPSPSSSPPTGER